MNRHWPVVLIFLWFGAFCANAQFAPPPPPIPPMGMDEWKTDVERIIAELPRLYPDLYKHIPKAEFESELRQIVGRSTGKSPLQVALEINSVLSRAEEPLLKLRLDDWLVQSPVIPYALNWYAGGPYVYATVMRFEDAWSKRVVKIGDYDTDEALRRLGPLVAVANERTLQRDGLQWLRFPIANRMTGLSQSDTLVLTVEDDKARRQTVRLYPVNMRDNSDGGLIPLIPEPRNPDLRWQPPQDLFTSAWLPDDNILYVKYVRCMSREAALAEGNQEMADALSPFQPFADSVAAFLNRTPDARLVLDLRYNPGGNSADGIALARQLAALKSVNKKGRLYVAINLFTDGAAIDVAQAFRQHTRALLIGDAPGERLNRGDAPRALSLTRSQLQVLYPSAFVTNVTKGNPALLKPDVEIELRFSDYLEGKDPVLDYVRQQKIK